MLLLLHGADEFSAREELARLSASGDFDYNQDTFSGDDADFAQMRVICDTLPFLSERRLVVLLGLPKRKRGAASDADAESDAAPAPKPAGKGKRGKAAGADPRAFIQALADYAAHVPETTTLVIVAGERLEESSPLLLAAHRHGSVKLFNPPTGSRLEGWISQRAQAGGARITPEATRLLIASLGEDSRLLANEIEKLCVAVGRGGEIGAQQTRELTPQVSQAEVFDLTDALARRERGRALLLLHEQLARGTAPQMIIGLIAAQTRRLLQVKAMSERGMRAGQIAQTVGMSPFFAQKNLDLARQFSVAQLEAAHRSLLEADVALKSTTISPDLALDLLTVQFGA